MAPLWLSFNHFSANMSSAELWAYWIPDIDGWEVLVQRISAHRRLTLKPGDLRQLYSTELEARKFSFLT
jgi:hypothetical protein